MNPDNDQHLDNARGRSSSPEADIRRSTDEPSIDSIVDTLHDEPETSPDDGKKLRWKRTLLLTVTTGLIVGAGIVSLFYHFNLRAVQPGSSDLTKVTIQDGSTTRDIARTLAQNKLIRSESAFYWYARLSGKSSRLQSGVYRLSYSENVPQIMDHLLEGKADSFRITFYPGATLSKHRQALIEAGYTSTDVDAALNATYNHPLLVSKPKSADLEGYIYGETYEFRAGVTPKEIITRTFDEFYAYLEKEKLIPAFKARDLSLYEAITLASIIQREVNVPQDQKQVAQVFYKRLAMDMQLGSDVTYQYIADKTGQPRDTNLDSPYNTRRYTGLTPGPIASPGAGSLQAVAYPAKGDYLYFLSGDDDKTYFGRTEAEHQRNIRDHCQEKCKII